MNVSEKFALHKICVIIPTYNNSSTLKKVVDDVLNYTENVIVVNDGSSDSTKNILENYKNITTINYEKNSGKGFALRMGFESAFNNGFHYAITIDSDGQHSADDILKFICTLEKAPNSIIIGARNMNQTSVPAKSSFGHKFSNFWFWVETGISLPDTQSGFRLYPLLPLKNMKFFTRKYEFEIEIIVRAAWKNINIESVPVSVYYGAKRISHFRPFRDFTRVSILNTILVLITFLYINPTNFIGKFFKKSTYKNLRSQILNSNESILHRSVSLGFGVFMGIAPIWGFQLLSAIFLAILFRLNKILVVIGANISIPPMIPLIIYLSFKTGEIWTGKNSENIIFSSGISLETIHLNFIQYFYGSITLAVISSFITGIFTYLILSVIKK